MSCIKAFVAKEQCHRHPHANFDFYFDGHRNLGWALGRLGDCEATYIAIASKVLGRLAPSTIWDVGANVGFWTLFFCGLDRSVEHVYCYEPDDDNLRLLRRNVDANQLRNVVIRACALSDQCGTGTFNRDQLTGATGSLEGGDSFIARHFNAATSATAVPMVTIDGEIAGGVPPPQFLKIDVEGHESSVLRGGLNLLRHGRPTLIMEVTGDKASESMRILKECEYHLIDAGTGREVTNTGFEILAVPVESVSTLLG
jgi:FkbM family methyltransferase